MPEWLIEKDARSVRLKSVEDVYEACGAADIVVLLQPHSVYEIDRLAKASTIMLDTRGVASALDNVVRL